MLKTITIIPCGVRLGNVFVFKQRHLLTPSTLGYTSSLRKWTCSIVPDLKAVTTLHKTSAKPDFVGYLLRRKQWSVQTRTLHLDLLGLRKMTDNRYGCDYAKLGTSGCKKCKTKIAKGELRIAKIAANPFGDGDMKLYHHPKCIFETFARARATTKIIEGLDDIENNENLKDEDKDLMNELIKETMAKKGSPTKTPRKTPAKKAAEPSPAKTPVKAKPEPSTSAAAASPAPSMLVAPSDQNEKDNSFRQFRRLCADVAEEPSYTGKTSIVTGFLKKGTSGDGFKGDLFLLFKCLLPGVVKTVYNINSKQLAKIFSQVFGASQEEMVGDLDKGDVAETVKDYFENSSKVEPQTKSTLSLHDVENMLTELATYTKEDDQHRVLNKMAKKSTSNDLKMIVRLIKHDLRINAGAKHILDALDPNAYEAFKASRNLKDVIDRVVELRKTNKEKPGLSKKLSIKANLMTAVQPMLAEACKSVEFAFKRCPNGMYSEIKYDGERVQLHKQGDSFHYFSRSLKPVQAHKVAHFKDYIPKAFPHGNDIILDAEVLLIDTNTGKPLPFGTLGVHKKAAFKEANVCLFVFDCLHFNGESLMDKPIKQRRKFLLENMKEVKNHVMYSEMKHITEPEDLKEMMLEVFREGLEGLVLKDVMSVYEPGKRHWLKVKKDYLAEGAMADSADLVVLGAYYGTGNKVDRLTRQVLDSSESNDFGGLMSVFLMGVYDKAHDKWKTVTKCHGGFDDALLEKLQKQLDVVKISKDYAKVPSWLRCNRNVVPDFVVKDPKSSPVWEITGAEFTKSDSHTADGLSIRFPRMTKIRKDKSWKEATDLDRLKELFKKSKEFSDIPDFLGGSPTKKGKFGKKAPVTPKKGDSSPDEKMDTDEDSASVPSTPVKHTPKKRKPDSNDDSDVTDKGSPLKKKRKEDSKPPCKFGPTCYQKNPEHRAQFSHSANGTNDVGKAIKEDKHLPDVFKGMSFYIDPKVEKNKLMERYIIAFDGDTVAEFDKDSATHIVSDKAGEASPKIVSSEWIWKCIKAKKFLPK